MLQTFTTANLSDAAPAASVQYRLRFVLDERRTGFASTLAERCVR